MPVAPRVPGGVHLVPEADDNRVAEIPDAVRIGAQVFVVVARGDSRDRSEGWIDLNVRDDAMTADQPRVGSIEGLSPAAVIAKQVRLPPSRPREVRDRLVGRRGTGLE